MENYVLDMRQKRAIRGLAKPGRRQDRVSTHRINKLGSRRNSVGLRSLRRKHRSSGRRRNDSSHRRCGKRSRRERHNRKRSDHRKAIVLGHSFRPCTQVSHLLGGRGRVGMYR